jgi:hypothetical protein
VPSSMIFGGLVIVWLLILVPTVARHRQEVARPSEAALAGRVLERPKRPEPEVDDMHRADESGEQKTRTSGAAETQPSRVATVERAPAAETGTGPEAEPAPVEDGRRFEHPAPRYRRGRGGFDAEAAAYAARARATFRQRVVLALIVGAVASVLVAALALPVVWWLHLALDATLVGYLVYLRRQVRMEEAIRERRAARMAGTARRSTADDPELDEWAARGRAAVIPEQTAAEPVVEEPDEEETPAENLLLEEPERVAGTGAPLPRIVTSLDELTVESALPRLQPAPTPPIPNGTVLVEEVEDDPELADLDDAPRHDYRRAAGA